MDKTYSKENIREMFNQIAPSYDLVNLVISLGLDTLWRRRAIIHTHLRSGQKGLDVACGTGKSTLELSKLVGELGTVVGIDMSEEMLAQAEKRIKGRRNISLIRGDAMNLPFPDDHFDAAVMCFALRNMLDIEKSLYEMERVVKSKGRVVILDLFHVEIPFLRPLYWFYLQKVIPTIGSILQGDSEPYRYLAKSISQFPPPSAIACLMQKVGLKGVYYTTLMSGGVGIIGGEV